MQWLESLSIGLPVQGSAADRLGTSRTKVPTQASSLSISASDN